MKRFWHSGFDAAVAAILLAVIQLAYSAFGATAALGTDRFVSAVFGFAPLVLAYWLYIRLWLLMRSDGPAALMLSAVVAKVVSDVYTNLWALVLYKVSFVAVLDEVAFAVRLASVVLLALALLRWNRMPRWAGLTVSVYGGLLPVQGVGDFIGLAIPALLRTALWSAALVAIAAAIVVTVQKEPRVSPLASEA